MSETSPSQARLKDLCREIGRDLEALVMSHLAGEPNERALVESLLQFEAQVARQHGLVITASNTFDEWTVIKVRVPGVSEPCSAFEFHPQTGKFRPVGTACRS
jgi:hypothetical protein